MGTNPTGCTEWERDFDPMTEQPAQGSLKEQTLETGLAALTTIIEDIDRSGARLKRLADDDAPSILFKREADLIAMRVEKARDILRVMGT